MYPVSNHISSFGKVSIIGDGQLWINNKRVVHVASEDIAPYKLIVPDTDAGTVKVASANAANVIGVNSNYNIKSGKDLYLFNYCHSRLVASGPIAKGDLLKAGFDGGVSKVVDSSIAGGLLKTIAAGAGFTNQPANDNVKVVSDSALDTGFYFVTLHGIKHGETEISEETITLNGVTAVETADAWDVILMLTSLSNGTVTVTEKSGGLTIATIASGANFNGKANISLSHPCADVKLYSDGATTKKVGISLYVEGEEDPVYKVVTLNGTNKVSVGVSSRYLAYALIGDLEAGRKLYVQMGDEDPITVVVGRAITEATANGDVIDGWVGV